MAFQANAFQSNAFQVCANKKPSDTTKYKRVWIPDKEELKDKVTKAEEFLDDIKEKAEGFDDVLRYERKLSNAVTQFKESGGRDSDEVIYDTKAMARLQQILLSIELFEDDMLEMLALLLLLNEV
jgi:hypothetical protein